MLEGYLFANFIVMIAYHKCKQAIKLYKYSLKDVIELSKSINNAEFGFKQTRKSSPAKNVKWMFIVFVLESWLLNLCSWLYNKTFPLSTSKKLNSFPITETILFSRSF